MTMSRKAPPADPAISPPPPAPRTRKRLMIWLLLIVLLAAAGGGAAYYMLVYRPAEPQHAPAVKPVVASYFTFDEAFTCNLAGSARLMQVKLSVSTMAPPVLFETLSQHEAPLRAAILALLMEQPIETVTSRAGKQTLSRELRDVINAELERHGGDGRIDAVYVTDLIIQ